MIRNIIYKLLIILPFYFVVISFIFYNLAYAQSLEPPIVPNRPTANNIRENLLKNAKDYVNNKRFKNVYLNNAGEIVSNSRFSFKNLRFIK
jgi:hypothetical protein